MQREVEKFDLEEGSFLEKGLCEPSVISKDELIGVWLKREYSWDKWKNCLPGGTSQSEMDRIVTSTDYSNEIENIKRYLALVSSRGNLLADTLNADWRKVSINKELFKELRVINNNYGWRILSKYSGLVSEVAQLANTSHNICISFFKRRSYATQNAVEKRFWNNCVSIMTTIKEMKKASFEKLNKSLILLRSSDSQFTTILEGNKTAVTLYTKYFITKETEFEPSEVYIGDLKTRSKWQQ